MFTYRIDSTDADEARWSAVRFLISDTNPDSYIFENEELVYCLSLEGDDPRMAAAQALETWARSKVKLSKTKQVGSVRTESAMATELLALAKGLRSAGGVQVGSIAVSEDGERLSEYAPGWRGLDLLVVE